MGVYIPDMEMPKSCALCWMWSCCPVLSVDEWPDYETIMDNEVVGVNGVRDSNCPLVPVPPHGRLIDADAAAKQGWGISRTYSASPTEMVYEVKTLTDEVLPTIIPADKDINVLGKEEGET